MSDSPRLDVEAIEARAKLARQIADQHGLAIYAQVCDDVMALCARIRDLERRIEYYVLSMGDDI